ncbi:hypothetical protein LXL04_013104 [Taraxacum kok-saghyz]
MLTGNQHQTPNHLKKPSFILFPNSKYRILQKIYLGCFRDFCMEGMIHYWSQLDSMDMEVDLYTRIVPVATTTGQDSWKFAYALMAIYIGGAINYVAVSEALGVSPSVVAARLNLCLGLMNKYQLELEPQLEALIGRKPWSKFMNADNQHLVSPETIDFLDKLLCYYHQDRLTAKEAMVHPYFMQVRAAENSRMRTQWCGKDENPVSRMKI